ncbi:hypothetical protein LTR92_002198 [Exophiala xenobiotica]|nr:hypothetical protein LTR92_002198 [Exophiala xenobiotica]KAK5450997.1 hypothetical protein LTR18_001013 [Exophiala xenobiotica]
MADGHKDDFEIDPELDAIWQKTGRPKFFFPKADKITGSRQLHARGNVRFMKSKFVKETLGTTSPQPWTEEDRSIVVRDGAAITIRIYQPRSSSDSCPVMVFAHSGGWCMGGLETEEFICQLLCIKLNIIIVSVAYRLAPEVSYPTICYDVYDAMRWVSVNAHTFGGDLSKGFISGGVSGGGNLTMAATMLAREDELRPKLTGHLFICTGMPHVYKDLQGGKCNLFPEQLASGSWETYKNGPVANRAMCDVYADMAKCNVNDPLFTPLNLTDFSKLGPIYYQIAGMDMRKDSAVYCDKVKEAGGSVKMDLYPGVPHVWYSMYPELSINKKWSKDLVTGVGWLLTQKPESQVVPRL